MAVPAKAALYLFSLHGLVTGNNVFYSAGNKMPKMGQSCSERGAIVKNEFLFTIPLGDGFLEDPVIFPNWKKKSYLSGRKTGFSKNLSSKETARMNLYFMTAPPLLQDCPILGILFQVQ